MILVNYLDNIITIIIPKFQTLVTSITAKLYYVSGKKHCFEIINEIDKWRIRDKKCDNSGVHGNIGVSLQ